MEQYAEVRVEERALEATDASTSSGSGRALLNINNLPLPVAAGEENKTAIFQSAVFIEDGVHYRSIHHRIDPTSLRLYRVYYSRYCQWLLGVIIFLNLILAFFEFPTSLSLSSDYRFRNVTWHWRQPLCGVTESVDIFCLLFFTLDCVVKFYLRGWRRFIKKPWLVLYAFMLLLSFADLAISLAFCHHRERELPHSLGYTLRLRRFFRPFFLIISSSIMKKFVKAVIYTLPQIFNVMVLLVLHVYVFAMVGLLVFPTPIQDESVNNSTNYSNESLASIERMSGLSDSVVITNYSYYALEEGDKFFKTFIDAFVSLIILLTTANHPDVMIPIYQFNRFSVVYFAAFLLIGSYLILNLLIAVIYNNFKGFFLKSLQSSFLRRRIAFRAAFTILARKTHRMQERKSTRLSYTQEVVARDLVRGVLRTAKIPDKQIPLMYQKLETITTENSITWHQFRDVFDLVANDSRRERSQTQRFYSHSRAFQWFQLVIRHRFFAYCSYLVSIVHVILITVELQIDQNDALGRADSRLAWYNFFFVFYYVLEQIVKIVGFGRVGYFKSVGNLYEGTLTLSVFIMEILIIVLFTSPFLSHAPIIDLYQYDIMIRVMNILVVLRLLRLIPQVESLKLLIGTIVDLIKNLRGFAGIIVVVYYLFALLGMELFSDVDGPSENSTSDQKCGTYDNLNYYANNFHDFSSSLVTLWDIMVVNNWFVFLDKFAKDSSFGVWSKLYFIAWWLVAVVLCVNIFVSLLLDTFLTKWEAVHGQAVERSQLHEVGESAQWESDTAGTQFSDIHRLLSEQLVEPEEADIMHELQQHRDLTLV